MTFLLNVLTCLAQSCVILTETAYWVKKTSLLYSIQLSS